MSQTLLALCCFAGWTILLVLTLASYRVFVGLGSEKGLSTFAPDGSDLLGFGKRLTRAHLNCLEILPIFAAISLAAVGSGQAAATDGLAMIFVYARVAQSGTHMLSVSVPMVLIRATFFLVQIVILMIWIYRIVSAGGV